MLKNTVFIFLFLAQINAKVLFKKGWFRSVDKEKITLQNVTVLDDSVIPSDQVELKINAIIPTLYEESIRDLQNLYSLSLSTCGIKKIEPGAFQRLPNLENLQLKENDLQTIKRGVFNFLNITILFLNKNAIESIDSDAFDDMPRLYVIKLNSNKLSSWDSSWFNNTPRLTKLFFRRNFIELLQENAFKNVRSSNDTMLYLSKNLIRDIHPNAFNGLTTLGQIWLDRNNLTSLYGNMFDDVRNLETLMLTKNKIKQLPLHLFRNSQVQLLDVSANPMRCLPFEVVEKVQYVQACQRNGLKKQCLKELKKKLKESGITSQIQVNCN